MLKFRVICVVSMLTIVLSMPHQISANVPPPIESTTTDSGGLYTAATNISMPYAEVNASIHLSGSWSYNVSVTCTFHVLSLTTQNVTTAFVYPSVWSVWSIYREEVSVFDCKIMVNESLVNHTILSYDEFKAQYNANQTDWEKVEDCDFAAFNFSIDSGEPIFIDVRIDFSTLATGHNYIFDYIVDTARGWEGDTHEIVNIDFSRDLDTEIIEFRYYPDDSVSCISDNYTANTTWDLQISSFEYARVSFIVQQQEYPTYKRSLPPESYLVFLATIIITGVILIFAGLKIKGQI